MEANPFIGVIYHCIGGLCAASFYLPYKGVRKWSWECYWILGGIFSWIIAPWVVALITVPDLVNVLTTAEVKTLFWSYFFGMMWGVGGLTYGLSMRYLGLSLGNAVTLGFCAAFGTLMPPLLSGELPGLLSSLPGWVTLSGVGFCLAGIAVCGRAGVIKEREMPEEEKKASVKEFNFFKGIWVATLSGIMSAGMNYGITAGQPIAASAAAHGADPLYANGAVLIVVFAGGFTVNFIWCTYLIWKNGSAGNFINTETPLLLNYVLSAIAGTTWYFQFHFFGMGKSQMGRFDFSSWTLHMASIILISNLWGFALREWRGSSRRTMRWVFAGITMLIGAIVVVGTGNTMAEAEKKAAEKAQAEAAAAVAPAPGATVAETPPAQ